MRLLSFFHILVSIGLYWSQSVPAVAQEIFEPREFLSERLFNALEWKSQPHRIEDGAPAWQLCRMCASDASDNIEAHIAYLQFLKEVNAAVREFVGFAEVPTAPDDNPKLNGPSDGVRGAIIVHPSQDSALIGFLVYRLRIEGDDWFVDTAGISTYPEFDDKSDMITADCDATHKLTERERNLLLRTSRPYPSIEPITGNRYRGAFCIDGGPTISEISYFPSTWKEDIPPSKIFIRECAADDSITQFNKVIASLGGLEGPLRHCVRSPSSH